MPPRKDVDARQRILDMADGVYTSTEIAETVGCTTQFVLQVISEHPTAHVAPRDYKKSSSVWTDERVELLKKLWAEGLSASQIAGRLKKVTRSAVLGKVHRLGLGGRATTARKTISITEARIAQSFAQRSEKKRTQTKSKFNPAYYYQTGTATEPEPYIPPPEPIDVPICERKTLQELEEDHCRWPIGDPQIPDFRFCGRQKIPGLSYCSDHQKCAYVSPPKPTRTQVMPVRDNSKMFEEA